MTQYQTAQISIQKLEELNIAKQVGEGKLDLDTAITKIDSLAKPTTYLSTESGSVSFRPVRCFKIKDHKKIPEQYILLNEAEVRKNPQEIPGVEYWVEQRPINNR